MERIGSLAIMNIHSDRFVNYKKTVEIFMRKIELPNLIFN